MSHALVLFLDPDADRAVRALRAAAGAPDDPVPPHLTIAAASDIPAATRAALRAELRLLAMPSLWFACLSTFTTSEDVLMLAAVTDTELLAVHSAVHDVLAGRVRNPNAYYLPGSWVPHCPIARADIVAAFTAVFPLRPIRARPSRAAVLDTRTGEVDVLAEY